MSNNRNRNNNRKTAAPSIEEAKAQIRNVIDDSIKQLSEHTQESLETLDEKFSSSIRNNVQELNNKIKTVHNEVTAVNQKCEAILNGDFEILYEKQNNLNKTIDELEVQVESIEKQAAAQDKCNIFYGSMILVLTVLLLISFL